MRNGGVCARPKGHAPHHVSEAAWERMRLRNAKRIAAVKLLDQYIAMQGTS
jgi:hypothetical protein